MQGAHSPHHHLTGTSQRTATARNGMGLQSGCLRLQPGRLRLQASRSSRRATTRPSPPQTSPSKARPSRPAHIGLHRVALQPAARTVAGMISGLLRMEFPQDRFMGEEDAAARPHGQTCPKSAPAPGRYSEIQRDIGRLLRLGDIGRYRSAPAPPEGALGGCVRLDPLTGRGRGEAGPVGAGS